MSSRTNVISWVVLLVFCLIFAFFAYQYKRILRTNEETRAELARAQVTLKQLQQQALEEEHKALAEYELRRIRR